MSLKFKFLNVALPLALVLSLSLTGCASKKKTTEDTKPEEISREGDLGSEALELYGDSDSGKAGALRTIYFAYDSSELTPDSRETLNDNAEFLKKNDNVKIQIEGHADERGGVQYNLALGERRAKAVKDYMVAMGISSNRISTISYGKERPLEVGHNEQAWSKNRRANFVVTEK